MSLGIFSYVADMADIRPESYWYLHMHFKDSMRASDVKASEGIPSDDPIWSFLDRLCQIDYYLPTFDNYPHPQHILHVWDLISETLRWVQRQRKVGSANCSSKTSPANTMCYFSSSDPQTRTSSCNINSAPWPTGFTARFSVWMEPIRTTL